MPKASWDILDFSGGLNKIVDKRDLEDNECTRIEGLIAHHPGSLKLGGTFLSIQKYNSGLPSVLGFTFLENYESNPIIGVQPSSAFIKFGKGIATVYSTDVVKLELGTSTSMNDGLFPFRRGQYITIIYIDPGVSSGEAGVDTDNLIGVTLYIKYVVAGSIRCDMPRRPDGGSYQGFSAHNWVFAVGADLIDDGNGLSRNSVVAYSESLQNNYVLINNGSGRFGYYDINYKAFVGHQVDSTDLLSLDQNYFNTKYLWDRKNNNQYKENDSLNQPDEFIMTREVSYSDGVVRVQEDPPKVWDFGTIRRPTGLYYIEKHKKFDTLIYHSGWYPLVTHCLAPSEYKKNAVNDGTFNQTSDIFIGTGGVVINNSTPTSPNYIHQVGLGIVASNDNGDWQFSNGSRHESLRFGVSLIYDDISHKDVGSFSQESSVTPVMISDLSYYDIAGTHPVAISGDNDKALNISVKVKIGNPVTEGLYNVFGSSNVDAIPENRGSSISSGHSNKGIWNPRIVGANIYLMGDHLEEYSSPLWLATIDFTAKNKSYTHDGKGCGNWTEDSTGIYKQTFDSISAVPVMDFKTKNGYGSNEPISMWYKTSAIVNRKLYAGNVNYFPTVDPHEMGDDSRNDPIYHAPDKIIVSSDANKFDVLPINTGLEIAKHDGQDIVKLLNFNNELLVFKTNDLVIIDCSGTDEIIKETYYGRGTFSGASIVDGSDAIYFCNKSGFYAYDGEQIHDLSIEKFTAQYWEKNIFNNQTRLLYDGQYNLIIITSNYNDSDYIASSEVYGMHNSKCYIYNIDNNAFFYKAKLGLYGGEDKFVSNGINVNGRLYAATTDGGVSSLSESTTVDATAFVPGQVAKYTVFFAFNDNSGTQINYGGATCEEGYLNTLMTYIKVYTAAGKWISLNNDGAFSPSDDQVTVDPSSSQMTYVQQVGANTGTTCSTIRDNINIGLPDSGTGVPNYHVTIDHNVYAIPRVGITMTIESYSAGATFNIVPQDIDTINAIYGAGHGDVPQVDSGKIGFMFANNDTPDSDPSTAGGQIGSIRIITDYNDSDKYREGTDSTGGVFDFYPRRNGRTESGVTYIIKFTAEMYDFIETITFTYVTGVNYWLVTNPTNYTYLSDTDSSLSSDTLNDNLVSNIFRALKDARIKGYSNLNTHYYLSNFATITKAGASGSQYIRVALDTSNDFVNYKMNWNADFNVNTQNSSGDLLTWVNDLPLDSNGDSLMSSLTCVYESKDIDFDTPNTRKKIYKAYITYKLGLDGQSGWIKCFYQANQSGTWTAAEVFDSDGVAATDDNRLNASTEQTRAELKFGTGGNNVYSFALKFEAMGVVSSFEINDLSIIYRLKNPK